MIFRTFYFSKNINLKKSSKILGRNLWIKIYSESGVFFWNIYKENFDLNKKCVS